MPSPLRTVRRLRRLALRVVRSLEATLRGNGVQVYWYSWTPNFGDLLTPALLRHYGWTPIPTRVPNARLLVVGSILQAVPEDFGGVVLGSGLVDDVRVRFERATIRAVRGELTRERIGAPPGTPLGDPGLLCDRLLATRQQRTVPFGIVPHYVDRGDPRIEALRRRHPEEVEVIDVRRPPRRVLEEIDRCRCLLSSSLHGLVAAHALGIPAAWLRLSDDVVGGGFKFRDYFSAFGAEQGPMPFDGTESLEQILDAACEPPEGIEPLREQLDRGFRSLRDDLDR